MNVQFWIIAACAIAVVIAVVIAVITVIAPPRGIPAPPPPTPSEDASDSASDATTMVVVDDAPSEITTVVSPDVAQNTNPDEEYTIVPVDSVPLEYEIKHLDLTDRSQGQYIPSWRDSMNAPAMSMGGKLKPLAKRDPMCNVMSEQEVTHTPEYIEKTENSDEVEFPIYHSTTSVQNFMSNRL